jgi:hypothetical protein
MMDVLREKVWGVPRQSGESYLAIAAALIPFSVPAMIFAVPLILGGGAIVAPAAFIGTFGALALAAFGLFLCLTIIGMPVGLVLL